MEQLLTTKLYIPPTRPDFVSRVRLVDQLNKGLFHKLTLISAPAGFGKTTLVSEWVEHLQANTADENQTEYRTVWLSLDTGDSDPARFLTYFIAALKHLDGPEATIGTGALTMLHSPQPPSPETLLTTLVNDLAAIPGNVILVLDDYHIIQSPPVDEILTFLLEHLPPQIHLVIATREDPQLPLARLRAQGQLTELRATDLRFTTTEATAFLNQVMDLDLSAENVIALEARTEGWVAGLQLAAISIQGHDDPTGFIESFTGSHRYVLDYLIEEILNQQSESIQNFLLQTSILDRLTGSVCNAITGRDDGQTTLERLEHANLFIIPLDQERCWYRYHHLFSSLLRQELRRVAPENVSRLHAQASEWYERNGYIDEAIEHALRADDLEGTAYLIEEHIDVIWQQGEHTKLRRWLAELPVDLVLSNPTLCILQAWDQFTSGQQDSAEQSLQAVEKALNTTTDRETQLLPMQRDRLSEAEKMQIRGRAAALRAFLSFYRGDIQGVTTFSRQALDYLPEQDLMWRSVATLALGDAYSFAGEFAAACQAYLEGVKISKAAGNNYMVLIASMKLAATVRQQGQLQQVIEICQQQLQLANRSGLSQTVVVGWLFAIWGEVLAELNDLDEALNQAQKGMELTKRGSDVVMLGWSSLCLVRVLFSRGNMVDAEAVIQKMEAVARESHVPPWITNQLAAWQARIWLVQNKLDTASQWVRSRRLAPDGSLAYLQEMEHMALARILIAQEQIDESIQLLQRLLDDAETGERTASVINILMLLSLAFQARDDMPQALTTLERALILAEPHGFIRMFVDEGPPIARLIYQAAARGFVPDYARQLLAVFPVSQPGRTGLSETQSAQTGMLEPLSDRETEILQLIADGLTNQEIGSRLFLSLNTVKVHTRNIYGKLGVHSRTQAVVKARMLHILPPA